MKTTPVLLILETSDIGARYTGLAARKLGYEPVFLADLPTYQADPLDQLSEFRCISTSTTHSAVLETIVRDQIDAPIVGVLTFLDSRLRVAAELAARLAVAGPDPTVIRLKGKDAVSALIPEFSPHTFPITPETTLESLVQFLETNESQDWILKPSDAAGAIGLQRLNRNEANLGNIQNRIAASSVAEHLRPEQWVLQEWAKGELFSVEGFVHQGKIEFIGCNGRTKIGNTEASLFFPYEPKLSPGIWEQAQQAVTTLVQRSGFENGYFHTEFIQTSDRPVLIDANIGRLGGGPLGEILAESHSVPVVDVYAHVIAVTLGLDALSPYLERARREITGICYGIPNEAKIHRVDLGQAHDFSHTRIVGAGELVKPMGENNWSWVGILTGPTETIHSAARSIRIETSGGWVDACYS